MRRYVSVMAGGLLLGCAMIAPLLAAPSHRAATPTPPLLEEPAQPDLLTRAREVEAERVRYADLIENPDRSAVNLLDGQSPVWSWQARQFSGLGRMNAQALHDWPTHVEMDFDEWIRATGEVIEPRRSVASAAANSPALWNYTSVAEIRDFSPTLPPIASIPLPGALGTGLVTLVLAIGAGSAIGKPWRRRR